MRCSTCGSENREGRKFCAGCGVALTLACAACGASNQPGERFCGECGKPLAAAAKESKQPDPRSYTPKHLAEKILTSRSAIEGERKQVTVLFVDVKGSMDLAEQVDPEEWHRIMDRFFAILSEGVHRFEGTINQFTGDGIMALFGAPIAHEDHARRACYAALHLRDSLQRYAEELKRTRGLSFSVRMGLNSGEVVVGKIGDDLRMDYTAQGQTVGLAARMEQLAAPRSAYLTDHTAKLVSGFFRLRDLGLFELKGVSTPIRTFELEGASALQTPIEVSRSRGFSRFVGRANEMASLEAALGRAVEGTGQVVGVVADPGLGKSRLCFEFAERCRARGTAVYEARGVSHGKVIPLLPVLEFFRGYFGITEHDSASMARDKIAGRTVLLDETLAKELPIMFEFLGVPDPERPTPSLDPEARQRQFFDLIRRLARARSAREPAVLLFEDLHWFDRASEKFIENTVVEFAPGNRTLVLLNFRPEFRASWMERSHYQQLPLLPLSAGAIAELLDDLLGTDPSVALLGSRIREHTAGNPFFIEEAVNALAEAGSLAGTKGAYRLVRPSADLALPATVQALLAARIDRLEEREKHVLQTAAVIGRKFTEPILRRVVELSEPDLARALDKLAGAEFIFEQSLYPDVEYIFKHALTQEVAYHSVLTERRKILHERAAQAIEVLFAGSLDAHYGELAHHYKHTDNSEKAVEYLHLAGDQAVERSANAEAVSNLTSALDLLSTLPETPERDRKEIALRTTVSAVLIATKGWASPERQGFLERARFLCQRLGEKRQLAPVLTSLFQVYLQQGKLRAAGELTEESLRLAETLKDPVFLSSVHHNAGEACAWTGELLRAQGHFEQTIALHDPKQRQSIAWLGTDPWLLSSTVLAWIESFIGQPDQALKRIVAVVARARGERFRLFELATALSVASIVRQYRREKSLTLEAAEVAFSLCSEQSFQEFLGVTRMTRGWALTELGQEEAGLREIAEGIEVYRSTGGRLFLSWPLGLLAWAHGKIGQIGKAFSVLAEAFAVMEQNGERFYEAELLRLKGELLLKRAALDDGGACFRQAITVARRQSAKTWELRATTSLARLLAKQRKENEGREMLAEIYGWFTEGFDTADLKEAKALIEDLS